jgi:hypothetical protein
MTQALDRLYEIAAAHGTVIGLRRDRAAGRWIASIPGAGSAEALTPNGAVRALADSLAPRSLVLCQREDAHG